MLSLYRVRSVQVAADVLSGGRSSRLIKNLVMRNACLSASCLPGYPGDLHPGLALVSAVPQSGRGNRRLQRVRPKLHCSVFCRLSLSSTTMHCNGAAWNVSDLRAAVLHVLLFYTA